jgi:hypothetical protein
VACSLTLLQQLVELLGRRFLDVLVADAIYLQTPFVRAIEALGLDSIPLFLYQLGRSRWQIDADVF